MEAQFADLIVRQELRPLPGFTSYKCSRPIKYPSRVCRDALIQATLDSAWKRLEPMPVTEGNNRNGSFGFVAWADTQRFAVWIGTPGNQDSPSDPELPSLALAREAVLAEPHLSATRSIWSHRNRFVPLALQNKILSKLETHGKMRIVDLVDEMSSPSLEVLEATFAMMCRGAIALKQASFDPLRTTILGINNG